MKAFLLALLAAVSLGASRQLEVTISPPRPTVGDLISVTFPQDVERIVIESSKDYELVESERNRIVIRSFRPGPLMVVGSLRRRTSMTRLGLHVNIASVLGPNDSLQPAALKPPIPFPPNRAARIAIASAVAAAILSWAVLWLLSRRARVSQPARVMSPAEEFRAALARAAKIRETNAKLALIGDATRTYLARVDPQLRREFTTFELLRQLGSSDLTATIREALTASDAAKFSPWGAEGRDYGFLIERLTRLPEAEEPKEEAA